jgi:hypothetical protein
MSGAVEVDSQALAMSARRSWRCCYRARDSQVTAAVVLSTNAKQQGGPVGHRVAKAYYGVTVRD